MKVTSSRPKGSRIKKTKKGKDRPFWIQPISDHWWFSVETREWHSGDINSVKGCKSSAYYSMSYHGFKDVYSLKAAKRKISKWKVPKGTKFMVSLPW